MNQTTATTKQGSPTTSARGGGYARTILAATLVGLTVGAAAARAQDMDSVLAATYTVNSGSAWHVVTTGPGPSRDLDTDTANAGDMEVKLDGTALPFYAGFTYAVSRTNAPFGTASNHRTMEAYPGSGNTATWLSICAVGSGEADGELAVAHFPYAAGWIGATLDADGNILGGNGVLQSQITKLGTGSFGVELGYTDTDGMVFAIGAKNEDNIASAAYDSANSRWRVDLRDNGGSAENDPISFLYVPFSGTGVIGGHIDVSASAPFAGQSAGVYTVEHPAAGTVRLTIPGYTPHNAVLVLATGDSYITDDNFLSYDGDGDSFLVHNHDLPAASAQNTDFRFLLVPIPVPPPTVGVVDEPAWTITQTTPSPYDLSDPGSNAGDVYVLVNGHVTPFGRKGIVLAISGGTSGYPADNLTDPCGPDSASGNVDGTWVSTVDLPNGSEQTAACNLMVLPYAGGWKGAYVAADGTILGGGRYAYGLAQSQIAHPSAGQYQFNGLPDPGQVSLFVVGNQNNQDHVVNVSYDDGSTTWLVRNVDEDDASYTDGAFCVALVDHDRADAYIGDVDAQRTATLTVSDMSAALTAIGGATVVKLGTGLWDLTIGDGSVINPATAILFVGSGRYGGEPNDNAWIAGNNGANAFQIRSLDLPGDSNPQDADFRFLIVPLDTTPAGEPTLPASAVTVSDVTYQSLHVEWARGTGDAVLVVIRRGAPPDAPENGFVYAADAVYGDGALIGTDSYVVYNGTGNSVDITGLPDAATFTVKVFEYNGLAGNEAYRVGDAPEASGATLYMQKGSVFRIH